MEHRPFFRRLVSTEVLAGAIAGAGLPYLIAWISEIAPTRVPLGLVALSVGGGAFLGWALLRAISGNGGLIWPHCGGLNWPHLRPTGC
jgi:hypothetical protein